MKLLLTIELPMLERPLKEEERILLQHLINLIQNKQEEHILPERVVDLDDGGMGSIRFGVDSQRKYGKDLIQVKYIDSDKTPVIITLIEDDHQDLFELEMWKVDFSELKQYPTPDKLY